jgi:Ca2+-binding RTX toxin-like protein
MATITGTNGPDTRFGTSANDIMRGLAGNDHLLARAGNDLVLGGIGDDTLSGEAGNDRLFGDAGNDTLFGGLGDDLLNGGLGADRMTGGLGNDTYIVNSSLDRLFESASQGTDTVVSAISFTLAANFENLTLSSGASGTGNAANNIITGNALANTLRGLAGQDTLRGRLGNDVLDGGVGNDLLDGAAGNDRLIGGGGSDQMLGGAGDDVYLDVSVNDFLTEDVGGGIDTVRAQILFGEYVLAANFENLTLTGTTGNGTGNNLDNVITGNDGDNTLRGNAGDDALKGGGGRDNLIGGAGRDVMSGGAAQDAFHFLSKADIQPGAPDEIDLIADFNRGQGDAINLNVDADDTTDFQQSFIFVGERSVINKGELGYVQSEGKFIVAGNTDDDAEPEIMWAMNIAPLANDFFR